MKKYDFVFNIGDRVKIKELNIKGKVMGIYISPSRVTYEIRYFYEGKPQDIYFEHSELEIVEDEELSNPLFNNVGTK
jgi:hypothetical protein